MNNRVQFARVFVASVAALCVQPLVATVGAQQAAPVAIDSVNRPLVNHPKPKKDLVAPVAAKSSASASTVKAKRELPFMVTPGARSASAPVAAKAAVKVAADSTPAVRRAPKVTKSKPPR